MKIIKFICLLNKSNVPLTFQNFLNDFVHSMHPMYYLWTNAFLWYAISIFQVDLKDQFLDEENILQCK